MPLPNTAAAAGFQNPEAYENAMGRWSRRLAPLLIKFGGLADGDRVLDVGCGTGSLTRALPQIGNIASCTGVDLTEAYVEFARSRNTNPHINFRAADARALPFEDNSFDRAFSMLVPAIHPGCGPRGGRDAPCGAVWGYRDSSGVGCLRRDAAHAYGMGYRRSPRSIDRGYFFRPLSQPNEVEQTSLLIRMEFSGFDDYWLPFTSEGPLAKFAAGLSATARASLTEQVRRAYVANLSDGPRSFASVAWACRGTVPA
jgi:SAM-dependent methyltransferase